MKKYSRYIVILLSFLVVGFLIYTFRAIVTYILIAWVLSMIGHPIMSFLKNKVKIGKFSLGASSSALLTLLLYFAIVASFILLFVPLLVEQANNLASVNYKEVAAALSQPFNEMQEKLVRYGVKSENSLEDILRNALTGNFSPGTITNFFTDVLSVAGNLLMGAFSVIFITFFFLKEDGLFSLFVSALVPSAYGNRVTNAIEDISHLLSRYFGAIFIQIIIITIFVSFSLNLVGVENALLIGIFAALINVIPYLGPMMGAIFAVFITISSNLDLNFYNEMLPLIYKVVGVFAIMQLLDNFILQPYIFSNSVKAHPLEIFIVILLGAQIDGVTGMILAIPTYTVIRVIAKEFLNKFKIVQKMTGGMEDGS